jgi:hypothetical protein
VPWVDVSTGSEPCTPSSTAHRSPIGRELVANHDQLPGPAWPFFLQLGCWSESIMLIAGAGITDRGELKGPSERRDLVDSYS